MTDAVARAQKFIRHQSATGVCSGCCSYDIIRDLLAEIESIQQSFTSVVVRSNEIMDEVDRLNKIHVMRCSQEQKIIESVARECAEIAANLSCDCTQGLCDIKRTGDAIADEIRERFGI